MTENLAARGEGLAGLAEAIKLALSAGADLRYDEYGVMEMPIGHLATKWDIAQAELQRVLAALEAAAPAGTARRSKLELSIAEECLKPAIDLLNDAIWNYREQAPAAGRPAGFGPGEYSCAVCGMGMVEPCEHWAAQHKEQRIQELAMVLAKRVLRVTRVDITSADSEEKARELLTLLVGPAATQEQPAGSGALREALCELLGKFERHATYRLISQDETELTGNFRWLPTGKCYIEEARYREMRALSLSSPIEPPRPPRTVGCTTNDDCIHECPVSEPESRLDEFKTTVIALWDPELTPEQKKAYIASRGKELREAAALAPSRQGAARRVEG